MARKNKFGDIAGLPAPVFIIVIIIIVMIGGLFYYFMKPSKPSESEKPKPTPKPAPTPDPTPKPAPTPDPSSEAINYIKTQLPKKLVETFKNDFSLDSSGNVVAKSTGNNTSIDPEKFKNQINNMATAIYNNSSCKTKYTTGNFSVFDECMIHSVWFCDKESAIWAVWSSDNTKLRTLPSPWSVNGFDCNLLQK